MRRKLVRSAVAELPELYCIMEEMIRPNTSLVRGAEHTQLPKSIPIPDSYTMAVAAWLRRYISSFD